MFYQAVERFGKIHFFCNSAGLQTYGTFIGTDEICPGSIDTPLLRFGASEHGETEKYLMNGAKNILSGGLGRQNKLPEPSFFFVIRIPVLCWSNQLWLMGV
ncbi:MAG: hypothetical protein KDD99_19105 [Bacteroidetes bacterium]|nr:hypothetical protein [Bacteroidota bacterium]